MQSLKTAGRRASAFGGSCRPGVHDGASGLHFYLLLEGGHVISVRSAITVALAVLVTAASGGRPSAQTAAAAELKAAYLLNFTKFSEWPDLPGESPLVLCVLEDPSVSQELSGLARGQRVGNRELQVVKLSSGEAVKPCQLLYVAAGGVGAAGPALGEAGQLPILTVSDREGFADATGTIELYLERDRMRFAINVDAVQRSKVRLSSRLLSVARIVHDKNTR